MNNNVIIHDRRRIRNPFRDLDPQQLRRLLARYSDNADAVAARAPRWYINLTVDQIREALADADDVTLVA